MAFEYPTDTHVLRLIRIGRGWAVHFRGRQHGQWRSPEAAAIAAARHRSGLAEWDRTSAEVSDDLLDWRPIGDSL